MLERDAILSKISIVKNCLATVRRITASDPVRLDDQMTQDVFVLNLQRAAQACIDAANLIIAEKGLTLPTTYKQSFQILARHGILTPVLAEKMGKMAGFRNVAIHDYQQLNVEILKSILTKNLGDFDEYCVVIHGLK